jgi:hypothetical protein
MNHALHSLLFLLWGFSAACVRGNDLPLHPDDLKIILRIAACERLDAAPIVSPKGWPRVDAPATVRFLGAGDRNRHAMTVGCDQDGRVTHIVGNGPLLCNEAFGWIAGLSELRVIRIDHNVPKPRSGVDHQLYDGSGIAALQGSKLEEIKIGHAFNDDGMRALAQIRSLRVVQIGHSRVTDAGITALVNHPSIEEASFSPMGAPKITNKTLQVLATLPKLKRIGMNETFVTYNNGFEHLKPLQGRLEAVTLRQSLVLPADVERLKADHPGLEVTTSTPAEVAEKPFRRNQLQKWASAEAVEYLETGIEQ